MNVFDQSQPGARKVFISYSSIDRIRMNGLGLLLEALGHQVFHDHRTIKPGMAWEAALQEGLDEADALMVFWTKHAARSDWVRKEYEYFYATYPDRGLVPVLGDETALTDILKTRQHADFAPLVNEVLEMKRKMKKQGAGTGQIEEAVLDRLAEAGVEFKTKKQKVMLFVFLGFGWLLTLLRQPWSSVRKTGSAAVEKTAQLTAGQAVAIGAAALAGLAAVPLAEQVAGRELITLGTADVTAGSPPVSSGPEPGLALAGVTDSLLAFREGLVQTQVGINMRLDEISSLLDALLPGDGAALALAQCRQDVLSLSGEIVTLKAAVAAGAQGRDGGGQVSRPPLPIVSGNLTFYPPAEGTFVPPLRISAPEPDVPSWARSQEGLATVEAVIDKDGTVSVQIAEPTRGPDVFAEVASDAVKRWIFKPGTLDGEPVPVRLIARVEFVQRR